MNCIYTSDVPCMKKCKDCYLCEEHKDENYDYQFIKYNSYYNISIRDGLDIVHNAIGKEQKVKGAQSLFDFIVHHRQIFILAKQKYSIFYNTIINKLNEFATEQSFGEQLATEYKNKLNLDNIIEEEIEPITYNIDDIVIEIVI